MVSRLDASAWRPIHTRIVLALAVGWALDSFEIQIIGSVIGPIGKEFHLSHTDESVVYWLVWFGGIMAGALGFGWLADRFGRRRMFAATLILYSVAAVLTALSPSWAFFLVFRFLTALGVGGEYSAVSSAMAEFVPARRRGLANGGIMNAWSVGGILAGVVGILFVGDVLGPAGWRYAFLFGAAAGLYGLFVRRLIPESPRWLAARGRHEEADAAIRLVTGLEPDADAHDLHHRDPSFAEGARELWRDHRSKLLYGMALDFSEAAAYYGIFSFIAVFVLVKGVVNVGTGTVPWYFVLANVGALGGGFTVAWLLDRVGRKPTVFWSYTAAALTTIGLAYAATQHSAVLTLVALVIAVFCASGAWMSAYPTFSELFPTHLRATGVGACVAVGRVGAVVGVVVLAETATSFGVWTAFLSLSALWAIGAVASGIWWLRGREGRGLSLEILAQPHTT